MLAEADAILISVPTPLLDGAPDLSRVVSAGKSIAAVMNPNSLVVLESKTYPGTTQDLLAPLLEERPGRRRGLLPGLLARAHRPGQPDLRLQRLPKVVGGVNEDSATAATNALDAGPLTALSFVYEGVGRGSLHRSREFPDA